MDTLAWLFSGVWYESWSSLVKNWEVAVVGKIGVSQADKKLLPLENRGQIRQNVGFWVGGGLGVISAVNIMKRIAQQLRIIIWLHFGLVSYRIQFRKTQKPCIFMFFGFGGRDHDSPKQYYFYLWRHQDTPNNLRKNKSFSGNNIFANIIILKS